MSIQNSQQISDIKTMLVKGMNGEGIESIEKTATEGFIDTYTITYTDGTKTTFDVTNGNWGIWTSAVTAAASATSVTINNDAIGTTSILEVYSQNASGTVITVNDIDVTPGTAVLTFPALAEATDFILHIVNGTASGGGGGGGGTTDYLDLTNKPQINGSTLTGNKTSGDLGIPNIFQGTIAEWNQLSTAEKKAYDHASIPDSIDGGVTFPANKVVMTGGGNVEDAIDDIGSDTDLGDVQGSGTITLADSVSNYRFIQIRIGYYTSGYPCFGQALLPVSTLYIGPDNITTSIAFSDGNINGRVDISFLSATSVKVVNTSGTLYTKVVGIA